MRLLKTESPYLTKEQWAKIFLAFSVMIITLYIAAMIASLCGSQYFILKFENTQLDKIEAWFTEHQIMSLIKWVFNTIEFCIVISFVLKKFPKWYYVLAFYGIAMFVAGVIHAPAIFYTLYPHVMCILIPIIDQIITNHKDIYKQKFSFKKYLFCLLRLGIAIVIVYTLQIIIFAIKDGTFSLSNHTMSLATHFIYAIEYDIALAVILFTILLLHREKGAVSWTTYHTAGLSSQTSTKQSQKSSLKKNLTKTQRRKLNLVYARFYITQMVAFLLLMVLPFLLGKVLEFLVLYAAFAVTRYILGFNYSLHYKKETTCITVGIVVFGILALAVPFFYIVLILAIALGISLAILLHLSYKYKGFYLFNKIAKPDKFAVLYVFFDEDLSEPHVRKMCKYKGLSNDQTFLILSYTQGDKISYIAHKLNYSQRMTIYLLDEAIEKLLA